MTNPSRIELLSDKPISSLDSDRFDRLTFISAVVDLIHHQSTEVNLSKHSDFKEKDENLIIGLYGPWGIGKSSVISMINSILADEKGLQTVFFNPWMYKSEETLLISLLNTVLANSNLKHPVREKAKQILVKLGPLITAMDNRAGAVTDLISGKEGSNADFNAAQLKDEISKLLSGKANPLIIFIDDIDRLSNTEIQVLFKALRLIASFPHVIYVLAFDVDMVAKSIRNNYSDGNIRDGKNFIEKIVQVPIRIPEIGGEQLYRFAKELINSISGPQAFKPVHQKMFNLNFHTPREVKRFVNSFRFVSRMLKGSVDFEHLILLELIRLKEHEMFEAIRLFYYACLSDHFDHFIRREVRQYFQTVDHLFYHPDGKINVNNPRYQVYQEVFQKLFDFNLSTLQFKPPGQKSRGFNEYYAKTTEGVNFLTFKQLKSYFAYHSI